MSRRGRVLLLGSILVVALALDTVGLDWGLPYLWHTDEKVGLANDMIRNGTLNPHYFINPHLHTYLVAGVMKATYAFYPGRSFQDSVTRLAKMTYRSDPDRGLQFALVRAGRGVSVVFCLATVVLVWMLGRRWADDVTALLAAAFVAFGMGFSNQAHYATLEGVFFLLVVVSLWQLELVATRGERRDYLWAGVAIGLACSTKYTGALLVFPAAMAHFAGRGRGALRPGALGRAVVAVAASVVAFFAVTPYALIEWKTFWVDGVMFSWYTGAPRGQLLEHPHSFGTYTLLLANAMGWPLFVLGLAGLALALVRLLRRHAPPTLLHGMAVHVAWIVGFFVVLGASPHHAMRFIMPIAPSLALLAAVAAMAGIRRAPRGAWRASAVGLVAAVIVYSVVYSARADYMMLHDTRYAAGEWLGQHELGPQDGIASFAIFSYLPYFDRPVYTFRYDDSVISGRHGDHFRDALEASLAGSNRVYVDSSFFYERFFDYLAHDEDRVGVYRRLLSGDGIQGYRLVQRFAWTNPWWLDPRPERISPEVVVFAKPGMIADRKVVRPFRQP